MNEYNLTEAEEKLFGLLATGTTVAKVLKSLSMSTYTYRKLVTSVVAKTNSNNRNHAVAKLARIKAQKIEK